MSSGMPLSQPDTDFTAPSGVDDDLQSTSQHWIGLEEAGDCLGMPLNHLRLAIDQGLLRANQDADGSWRVYIKHPLQEATPVKTGPSARSDEKTVSENAKSADISEDEKRSLDRELRLEAREDRLVTLLQESLDAREDQLAAKDRLLGDLSRQFGELSRDLVRDRHQQNAAQASLSAAHLTAQRDFDPARYDRALANIRETLKLVRDYLLEQK